MAEGYIAPPINQMSRQDLNNEDCVICFEQLYLPGDHGQPVEITTCHHRFHRDCLQTYCGNAGNRNNSLISCACPTCQRRFNFNIRLQDLTQQVADRFAVLDAEEAAIAAGPIVDAGPIAGLNPQLQNYLQANYEIDRITKEFTNCFSQIINDAVGFRQVGVNYGIVDGLTANLGTTEIINTHKYLYSENFTEFVDKIIQNYKNNSMSFSMLRDSIPIYEQINNNLQNAQFVNNLYQINPQEGQPNRLYLDKNYGSTHFEIIIGQLLNACQNGVWSDRSLIPIYSRFNNIYSSNQFTLMDLIDAFPTSGSSFVFEKINIIKPGSLIKNCYIPLIPITNVPGNPNVVRPDFQFFIRYFDCFVNFVRQLVAINFNVAQQLGGKRRQTRISKKGRKSRKAKFYGGQIINFKNRDIYDGDVDENRQPHGQGSMNYNNGTRYEGNWENGQRSGQGTMRFSNGDVYQGNWENNWMNGQGTMTYADGNVWVGRWINGKKIGRGMYGGSYLKKSRRHRK